MSKYRADIDGLRAVAVLAVFAYHLSGSWLPGGFVGVDIFFVISGYVVCHSLTTNRRTAGVSQQLLEFYSRRVRRLLPGLLPCLAIVAIIHAAVIPPFPDAFYASVYRTAATAAFGMSNLYLIRQGGNYFDGDARPNAFMHTWSLGVEEQFYMLFPLVALLLGGRVRVLVVCGLTAASAALCAFLSARDPLNAYYLMPSRFWELGVGCLLALFENIGWVSRPSKRSAAITAIQLFALAGLSIALAITPEDAFPFPWAILTVICTLALVAVGSSDSPTLVTRTLSTSSAVYIGRLSYSLYLWHWPVICVVGRLLGLHDRLGNLVAVLATFALSMASYHFIELPIRFRRTHRSPFFALATAGAMVLGIALVAEGTGKHRYRIFRGRRQDWSGVWTNQDAPHFANVLRTSVCHSESKEDRALPAGLTAQCLATGVSDGPTLFLLGDSHAQADWTMAVQGVEAGAFNLYSRTHAGCSFRQAHVPPDACDGYLEYVESLVTDQIRPGDIVMLAIYLEHYKLTAESFLRMRDLISRVASKSASVIIQAPLPVHNESSIDCMPEWFARTKPTCMTSRQQDRSRSGAARDFAGRLGRLPNVHVWDPYELLCPGESCSHFLKGVPLYRDDDHLSAYGARYLAPHFASFVKQLQLSQLSSGHGTQ